MIYMSAIFQGAGISNISMEAAVPGEHVWEELQGQLDVVEFLLQAGQSLLYHVLPAVDVTHDLVHGVLSLKY